MECNALVVLGVLDALYASIFDSFLFAACLILAESLRGRFVFLWHSLMSNELVCTSFSSKVTLGRNFRADFI